MILKLMSAFAVTVGVWLMATTVISLRQNIAAAKRSKLPYVVIPIHIVSIPWMVSSVVLLPLLKQLPDSWTNWWLPLVVPQEVWHHGHDPFARVGSDTFLAVSAGGIVMWTCEPEAVIDVEHRSHDFVKPKKMMQILNVFGPTLTASNGDVARMYRKMATISFNESVMKSAWAYTIDETESLMKRWIPEGQNSGLVPSINIDTARLALHILSVGLYGRRMDWEDMEGHIGKVSPGHKLSFEEAITMCMEYTPTIFFIPRFVLKYSRMEVHKKAYLTYVEWKQYMEELRDEKLEEFAIHGKNQNPNLLDAIVYAGIDPKDRPEKDSKGPHISPEAVMGNLFVFFLGGHETTANTMTFALTLLACLPEVQKKLQTSLDEQLGSRPPTQWSYERDLPALLSGYTGAFMNEVLRMYSILPFIPKGTEKEPKHILLGGKSYIIPPETTILINTSAAHRNPKYWPAKPSKAHSAGEAMPYPISSFNPDIWMDKSFTPLQGAFIPFSEGFRKCIGQRYAKVELAGAISRIFKDYSVELDVPPGDYSTKTARNVAWSQTRERAEHNLSSAIDLQMSLKMVKETPIRFTKRGHEQWFDMQ